MANAKRGAQACELVGHMIIMKPWWRDNRGAWFARARNTISGVVKWYRIDLPHRYDPSKHMPPSEAKRNFKLAVATAKAVVLNVAHVENLSTANLFEGAIEEFFAYKKPDLQPNSYRDLEIAMRAFAKCFQGRLVESIASVEIETAIRTRTWNGKPISSRTRQRLRSHLHSFFSWAARHGLCKTDPTAAMDIRGGAARRENALAFTPDEARTLMNMAIQRDPHGDLAAFLAVGFLTGTRAEGVARLRWRDVRFEEQVIALPPAASKMHTEIVLPLHAALGTYLRDVLRSRMPVAPDDRIIATTIRTLLIQFKRCIAALADTVSAERAETLKTATLRACRRTYATWLLPIAPWAVLKMLMGHKQGSGDVTMRYLVASKDALREAVGKLPAILPVQKCEGVAANSN